MKNTIIALLVVIVGAGTLWYFLHGGSLFTQSPSSVQQTATTTTETGSENFGTYAYECDEHVTLTLTPSSDTNTIKIAPVGTGVYPPVSVLSRKATTSGVRYEGAGVVLTARGETVTIGEGDSAINCSPVPSTDSAPLNFGD